MFLDNPSLPAYNGSISNKEVTPITTFAERIKQLRKEQNLTQQEFADRLGIKRTTIANYESGRNEPVDSVIALICREFHVNEAWLRSGVGEMKTDMTLQQELTLMFADVLKSAPDKRSAIIAALIAQPPEYWDLIADLAEEIVRKLPKDEKEG